MIVFPQKNPQDLGKFPVSVTLTDDNPLPMTALYKFNIIVTLNSTNTSSSNNNSSKVNTTYSNSNSDNNLNI
jgi:uncharacterized protein YdgA (DUF945 family)